MINKQKKYDEDLLKKQLKNNKLKTYLPQAKSYLYSKILERMRSYHAQRNKLQELRQMLIDIDFLMQKDLWTQAQKMLNKVFKLASKNKLWVVISQLWRVQFMIWFKNNFATVKLDEMAVFVSEIQQAIQKESNTLELQGLQAELRHLILKKGDLSKWDLAQTLKSCNQKLLELKPLTIEAQFYQSFGLANYLRIDQQYKKSVKEYQKSFELLIQYPELKILLLEVHLATLTNWIGVAINLLDEKKGQEGLQYLEEILQKQKKNLSTQEYIKYSAYHQFLIIKAAFDYGIYINSTISFIENSEHALQNIWDQVDSQVQLVILISYVYLSLAKQKYEDLIKWGNVLLTFKQKKLRLDLFYEVYTWLSIAYFELGEYELLKYQIRNLKRQEGAENPITKTILTNLNSCINHTNHTPYWQNIIEDLEGWATKQNSYPPMIIYTWALSKHQQRSFAAVHLETIKARRAFFDKT